jgi:hypothetical protein
MNRSSAARSDARKVWTIRLLVAAAVLAGACLSWETWDVKFKRSSGWAFGDGAYSVHLPPVGAAKGAVPGGSSGRHYFFFGDSWMWRPGVSLSPSFVHDPAANTPLPSGTYNYPIWGNTAAIMTYAADANGVQTPGSMTYYARRRPSGLGSSVNCTTSNCPVAISPRRDAEARARTGVRICPITSFSPAGIASCSVMRSRTTFARCVSCADKRGRASRATST